VHQLGGKFGSAINVALTEAIVDADVLALDIAELLQTLAEARDLGRISRRSPVPRSPTSALGKRIARRRHDQPCRARVVADIVTDRSILTRYTRVIILS